MVAHTFSPIDFIRVLGYLDDLIIMPGAVWLAVQLLPPEVLAETRAAAATRDVDKNVGRIGAVLIILVWVLARIGIIYLIWFRK